MKKTLLILIVAICASFTGVAQKLGHVNIVEVMAAMPEYKAAEASLKAFETELQGELQSMYAEYEQKVSHFEDLQRQAQADPTSVSQTLLEAKASEIQGIQMRLQKYQENGQRELQIKQEELIKPIQDKVEAALNTFGKENGYVYIFDSSSGVLLYQGGEDLTAKIKAKLGAI